MYLVLTALLALNISSEILQAFDDLRKSLKESTVSYGAQNLTMSDAITTTINEESKSGDTTNLKYKPLLNNINEEAGRMMTYLEEIEGRLEEIAVVDPLTEEIENRGETDANYRYWLGSDDMANAGRGNGEAKNLRTNLNQYVLWANQLFAQLSPDGQKSITEFKPIALDPSEDPSISDRETKAKSWEYMTFHNKPVIADLTMVEKFKNDIREVQSQLLTRLKNVVGGGAIIKVDKLVALEVPSATVVAAGMPYETKLMVGMSSTQVKPEFFGSGVKVSEDGNMATMKMMANGNVIPNGANEGIQHYKAMIKVPKIGGGFEELPVEGSFMVRRPAIEVRSASVQLLYKDCGNKVIVDVPALGESYTPDFSKSKGGKAKIAGSNPKEVTLVPTQPKFTLTVYSKTNGQNLKIGNVEYNVIRPPKPRMAIILPSGQEYDGRRPVNRRQNLKVKLIPDADFRRTLPRDARYKVSSAKLYVQSGLTAPVLVETKRGNIVDGITFNLYQGAIRNARPGDKIFVELEGAKRVNFEGKAVSAELNRYQTTASAVLR